MRFLTPAEQKLLEGARPSERVIVRDFYELLGARLVDTTPGWSQIRGPVDEPLASLRGEGIDTSFKEMRQSALFNVRKERP